MIIGLEDWVKDLGCMPSLCIHASYKTSRSLSSMLSDVRHVRNFYGWAQSIDKLKRTLPSTLVMCFHWKNLFVANGFNFFKDCSSLFDKLLWALMGIGIHGNMMIRWSG